MDDAELVRKILETGDTSWFEYLYDRYANKVYHRCLGLLGNTDEAGDACHDIFVKVFLRLNKFNFQAQFGTWIYAVCYNHCIDLLRRKKRYSTTELSDQLEDSDGESSQHEGLMKLKVKELNWVLDHLRIEERSLLLMKYQDEMSIAQISALLGLGESAVKMRLKRARAHALDLYHNRIDPILDEL